MPTLKCVRPLVWLSSCLWKFYSLGRQSGMCWIIKIAYGRRSVATLPVHLRTRHIHPSGHTFVSFKVLLLITQFRKEKCTPVYHSCDFKDCPSPLALQCSFPRTATPTGFHSAIIAIPLFTYSFPAPEVTRERQPIRRPSLASQLRQWAVLALLTLHSSAVIVVFAISDYENSRSGFGGVIF